MQHKTVSTFEEDMQKFGLSTSVADQRTLSGMGILTEDAVVMASQPGRDSQVVEGLQFLQHFGTPVTEQDPIEGPVVTHELFNRIAGLDFSRLTVENIDEILGHLKAKDLPEGDERLTARAAEVVNMLLDEKTKIVHTLKGIQRQHIDMSTAGKARRKERRKDWRANKGGIKTKTRRVRKTSKYQLHQAKLAKKWGSVLRKISHPRGASSLAKKAKTGLRGGMNKAAKFANKFGVFASADMEIANDLRGVLSESRVQAGARSEVIERLNNIFALVSEMYDSESIDDVLEEAFLPVVERAGAGTLTEDTLNDEEFVAALAPCLNVVTRVMESIENGEVDFDYLGDEADEDDDEDESGN